MGQSSTPTLILPHPLPLLPFPCSPLFSRPSSVCSFICAPLRSIPYPPVFLASTPLMAPSSPTSNSEDEFLDEGLHDHILLEHFPSDPIPPSASRSPSPPKAVLSSQSSEAPLEEAPVSQEWVNLDEEASDEAWQIALLQSLQTTESNRPNPSNPPSEHGKSHFLALVNMVF